MLSSGRFVSVRLLAGSAGLCFLWLAACGVTPLAAQTTSTIAGTVTDSSGAVLVGVPVTARHGETGATRYSEAGPEGRYVFPAMPVGVYELRAEHTGFKPLVQEGIRLVVGETAVIDFELAVGALGQVVTVQAEPSLLNFQSGELSYLVGEEAIQQLPLNGRNYTDLALLQPGVVAFRQRDGGSVVAHGLGMIINGRDPRSNVYLLDGTPQNDFTNGPAGSAAGTALGMETIREFRVEVNAYSAEFGRNGGGQINVLTKSGGNDLHGSLFYFHRNDNFDARNFFDPAEVPEFKRNQFGATVGGPLREDKTFFFVGYEALRENKGRTILTVAPDDNARSGILSLTSTTTEVVGVDPAIQPYLLEFPVANGSLILIPEDPDDPNSALFPSGLANHTFGFQEILDQDFFQARIDHEFSPKQRFFGRYTIDDAGQRLSTDFPQFPRTFISRNQFFTGEYQYIASSSTLHTARLNFSRTRIGQDVEVNTATNLPPFVPGRPTMGDINIGGIPRFGPQISIDVQLVQNVMGGEYSLTLVRGRHQWKFGGLAERYQDNMFNPTFSRGLYIFSNLRRFLTNLPFLFIGLTPEGELDRYWRFTLFGGYAQDNWRVHPRLTFDYGVRYEFATVPKELRGRDTALLNLTDSTLALGKLYNNPTKKNISPRIGLAWDVFGRGRTSLRSGYGWYFNTNNQQNLIVTITNPPFTPRFIISGASFPNPDFSAGSGNSIRPIEVNLKNPNVHHWNLSIQQQLWADTVVTAGYAGSRGIHLLRSGDVNTAIPDILPGGSVFYPVGGARRNPAFSTIELKRSDGNSWYHAFLFEVRRQWSRGLTFQSSYTFSRNIDTTQASTFFSDATNGTTSAMPEFPGGNYNKGLADYHAQHNWVMNFTWQVPLGQNLSGAAEKILGGWQVSGIANVRSGNPLTLFVARNRSRSLWSPSLGPGLGVDRPNFAPGRTAASAVLGGPDGYFDPTAFVLQEAGRLGNMGRGALIGPNFRTFDLSLQKEIASWSEEVTIQFRAEFFNLFNRANFGTPNLLAYAGVADGEATLPTLGRIRKTVTSSRQIQLGLRLEF